MKVFVLVVIDQLRWQDHVHFPRLDNRLGVPRCVSVPYLPSVTETAHASISVATLPAQHGVIGGGAWVRSVNGQLDYLKVDDSVFLQSGFGAGNPFCRDLSDQAIDCFVLAAKHKVGQLIYPRPALNCLRVTFDKRTKEDDGCWVHGLEL